MLVPGVRIVRGPDWNWDNQGNERFAVYKFVNTVLLSPTSPTMTRAS